MDEKKTIQARCFFCFSTDFILPHDDYEMQSGEMIQCSNCGRLNDYDSLMRVAKHKGEEWAEEIAQKMIKNAFGK